MAKLSFLKLNLKLNNDVQFITFNDNIIEIKQYLPVNEKLKLISNILELSHDQNNFANPIKVQVYTALEIVEQYTNINFTDKQKENPAKLYDLLVSSGLLEVIINSIPVNEYKAVLTGIDDTITAVYKYQNSILGILDSISQDYTNLNFDIDTIKDKLTNPQDMATLKELAKVSGLYEGLAEEEVKN